MLRRVMESLDKVRQAVGTPRKLAELFRRGALSDPKNVSGQGPLGTGPSGQGSSDKRTSHKGYSNKGTPEKGFATWASRRSQHRKEVVATIIKFPRKWWRDYSDWRWVVTVVVIVAFLGMVLLPSGIALALRGDTTLPKVETWLTSQDEKTTIEVYQTQTGKVTAMPLGDYLIDVLAAQLPPTAPQSSLQAAAIAARTYAVRAILLTRQAEGITTTPNASQKPILLTPSPGPLVKPSFAMQHGADVTDNGSLDLPVQTEATQEDRWGSAADANRAIYQQAILATDGQVLTYKDQLILAFTFEVSPGRTRSAKTVFGQDIPYLQSIACPDDISAAGQPAKTFTANQLVQALNIKSQTGAGASTSTSKGKSASKGSSALSPAQAQAILSSLRVVARDGEGFVESVAASGASGTSGASGLSWSGSAVQTALGLPSANFSFHISGDKLVVETKGVGLDVGLSLHEAQVMGERGLSTSAILAKYYPGTTVTDDGLPEAART